MSHTPIHVRVTVTAIPASVETLTESIGSSCLSTRTYELEDCVTECLQPKFGQKCHLKMFKTFIIALMCKRKYKKKSEHVYSEV